MLLKDVHAAAGSSGYTAISTFSGCGGSSTGLALAGFDVRAALEFVPEAATTYRANYPKTPVVERDIRTVTGRDMLTAASIKPGTLDLLEGSPPCAAFSLAGKREKGWGKEKAYSDTVQRVDDLFFEWIRLAAELQPRALVAENVKGLTIGKAVGYLKLILKAIEDAGFKPTARVLDASWLGVAQSRQRLIIIAARNDLYAKHGPIPFPRKDKVRATIRDVIDLPKHPRMSGPMIDPETGVDVAAYPRYKVGKLWFRMRAGKPGQYPFQMSVPDIDSPVQTITTSIGNPSAANPMHPTEPRTWTIPELRRLCGFPYDYALTGTHAQRAERLGRSVVPPMYQRVGENIREYLRKADG